VVTLFQEQSDINNAVLTIKRCDIYF